MKKIFAILALIVLISSFSACQTSRNEPEEQMIAGTILRIDSIMSDFDRYHEAIFADADTEVVEEAAQRVMSIIRHAWAEDWLEAMQIELESGEWGIESLLILVGSRVAEARSEGDDRFEEELTRADALSLNEVQAQILQRIHASIEYFENL